MRKILIAVPTYESIYPDTFKSIYGLERGNNWVVFDFVRGYDCATARNNIAKKAMEDEADYVLMVDSDVILPPDALINLLEGEKDVCLGFYAHRVNAGTFDGKTCICKLGEYNYTWQYTADEARTLREKGEYKIRIHGGGMGCALIRTDIFKWMEYPWYHWVNYKDGGVLSEDLYFCEECGKRKIPIYADTRVCCGHILRYTQGVM